MASNFFEKLGNFVSAIADSTIGKAVKFAASAIVGVPCGVVATAVVGAAYLGASAVQYSAAYFRSGIGSRSGKTLIFDPVSTAVANFFKKGLGKIWSGWVGYAPIQTAKFIRENWAEHQSEAGYGNAKDEGRNDPDNRKALMGEEARAQEYAEEVGRVDDKVFGDAPECEDPTAPETTPLSPRGSRLSVHAHTQSI